MDYVITHMRGSIGYTALNVRSSFCIGPFRMLLAVQDVAVCKEKVLCWLTAAT